MTKKKLPVKEVDFDTPIEGVTAAEAYERYKRKRRNGGLRQEVFNERAADGRQVACALGVIDKRLQDPSQCPAQVMPEWLAEMVPELFDEQPMRAAFAWGEKLYEQLARLDGQVGDYTHASFYKELKRRVDRDWDIGGKFGRRRKNVENWEEVKVKAQHVVDILREIPTPDNVAQRLAERAASVQEKLISIEISPPSLNANQINELQKTKR